MPVFWSCYIFFYFCSTITVHYIYKLTTMKQEVVNKHLIDNGIRPLRKRALIYNYLMTKRNHPTVETIFRDLLTKEPSLSKTTVYNVLNLLIEKNLVQTISIEGNELRYDADVKPHGHFKCTSCGKIFDFDVDEKMYPKIPLEGFTTHQVQYYITGECPHCTKAHLN